MATKIIVTPEKLENTASTVDSEIGQFINIYSKFYAEVDSIKASHKSEATDTFVAQAHSFKDDFIAMETLLKKYAQFLRDAAKDYRTTDAQLASEAKSRLSTGR